MHQVLSDTAPRKQRYLDKAHQQLTIFWYKQVLLKDCASLLNSTNGSTHTCCTHPLLQEDFSRAEAAGGPGHGPTDRRVSARRGSVTRSVRRRWPQRAPLHTRARERSAAGLPTEPQQHHAAPKGVTPVLTPTWARYPDEALPPPPGPAATHA